MDGTLADVSGIRHYVMDDPRRKNFEKFHAAASYVAPMPLVVETVTALQRAGLTIVVLTSRKERWRRTTRAWLDKWEVPFDALGMRSDADERRDDDVKRDLHAHMLERGYTPVLAIDDNPTVVALWRSIGLPVVVVPGWVVGP